MQVEATLPDIIVTLDITPIQSDDLLPIYRSPADATPPPGMTLAEADLLHQTYHRRILDAIYEDETQRRRVALALLGDRCTPGPKLMKELQLIGSVILEQWPASAPLQDWWRGQPDTLEAGVEEHITIGGIEPN